MKYNDSHNSWGCRSIADGHCVVSRQACAHIVVTPGTCIAVCKMGDRRQRTAESMFLVMACEIQASSARRSEMNTAAGSSKGRL